MGDREVVMDDKAKARRKMVLDCAEQILRQNRAPSEERKKVIEGLLQELQLTEGEVIEIAIELVAP